jgi:hypothetical protein
MLHQLGQVHNREAVRAIAHGLLSRPLGELGQVGGVEGF